MTDKASEHKHEQGAQADEGDRTSLVAFLKSITFRRGGKREEVAECDGHFAGLQAKIKRRSSNDETLAIRSAN